MSSLKLLPSLAKRLPYGRQQIEEDDIAAVVKVLRSDWLTTGPAIDAFEVAVARYVGAEHGVAVSSGTAALHAAMYGLGLGPGDEVIVPPMTFAATANAAVFVGATPVFADVDADTLLIDPSEVSRKITSRTKAIVAVDYAGQPCDYEALRPIAAKHGIALIADGCHALGARADNRCVGSLADMTAFSFHPVKHITTGEGGMVTTDDAGFAQRMRTFRNHGITTDHRQRTERGMWFYEMADLGFNYRISDFQCALGHSQLNKLDVWISRRQEIARRYDAAFAGTSISGLKTREGISHAYHLYVIRVPRNRQEVFVRLRDAGIGANVHYIPVHLHPFYGERFGYGPGLCPVAEAAYQQILSLPMYPAMTDDDVDYTVDCVFEAIAAV